MSFNSNVDYMPKQNLSAGIDDASIQYKKFQKHKWQVLLGTFLLVLIIANAVIWSRPAIFQSQAVLHFSYASQTEQEFAELALRQMTLHQQRLKSNNVIGLVAKELQQNQGFTIHPKVLLDALAVNVSLTGRVITLQANGPDPLVLKPMLDAWVTVYLDLIESETQSNNSDDQLTTQQQLERLEVKISEQRQLLQLFATENNITSIERDENRVLTKTKSLGRNLDDALADQAKSQGLLNSLLSSIAEGQIIISPDDKAQIDSTKRNLREINAKLSALSEKYTQAYLERDPVIVAQQKKASQLKLLIEKQTKTSQKEYLQETERNLSAAKNRVEQLNIQLIEQNQLAQSFSQKLEQYKRLDEQLKALQYQAQTLSNQQVTQEVSKPFDAKISLLEPAFVPDFPIGPDYQFYSLISFGVALAVGIIALVLFNFVFRQNPAGAANNFVVIPGQTVTPEYAHIDHSTKQAISNTPNAAIAAPLADPQRLLTASECRALFSVANNQGKLLVGLVLSGVELAELFTLQKQHVDQTLAVISIDGQFARQLPIQPELANTLEVVCAKLQPTDAILVGVANIEDLQQLLINIAHDARLDLPEQVSLEVLRHSYLTFLIRQGARLSDIEQIAGHTTPSELARYRPISSQTTPIELSAIQVNFPFV